MSRRAVDPSEIILDASRTTRAQPFSPSPWIRFVSRFLDYSWFFLLLWGINASLLKGRISTARFESFAPLEFALWIPIEAVFLACWGTTPARKFLGIRLWRGRSKTLPLKIAFKRSIQVWFRGLGMMIPVVNVLCLGFNYYRLIAIKTTSWDREEAIHVSYTAIARWRVVGSAIAAAAVLFAYFRNS